MPTMEWEAPGIVLAVAPHGEGDVVASVLTANHGRFRGLARGGASRTKAATWQPGNLLQARWVARLSEQLGTFTGELAHAGAAHAMEDPMALTVLRSACAVADAALPEREPHSRAFTGLIELLARLHAVDAPAQLVRWELLVLAELGYGLDLSHCAVSGETSGLRWVSPKTGRAVTDEAAGSWRERLLPLPGFLVGANTSAPEDWLAGLRLTEHFLERDALSHLHRPVPAARHMLHDRVARLAAVA